ncbi:hypothetical protein Fmac_008787 [Flemingia macrophylla]|uniref:Uncharacterized protein n=1 Tax=Flemingia macrophylla TaxID=520843 RepID=A0ABD1MZ95_9FABA
MSALSCNKQKGERTGMLRGDVIEKACALSLKAHKSPDKHYFVEKVNRNEVIIYFPGSEAVKDWYSQTNFGETKVDLHLFPSLKSIGNEEPALVNEAFLKRFQDIFHRSALQAKVEKAMNKGKQIVFAGHSSGAPVAILATLWALEKYQTPKSHFGIPPQCVTFGSPLVGNHIFSHATRRENWAHHFFHYVMRYDMVPRILLAPLSSLCDPISQYFNPKSKSFMSESVRRANATATSDFYFATMSNAATITNYVASKLMGSTETTLLTMANFIPLSPYRPFGTYIFCTGNGQLRKQIVIKNPEAVLQVLFFSAQLSTEEAEAAEVPYRSLREHAIYGTELQKMGTQNVVNLDQLDKIPLSEDAAGGSTATIINTALDDLGLGLRARLFLRAAAEWEARRFDNERKFNEKKAFVEEKLKELQKYREFWEHQKRGFYDGFREHEKTEDFSANVTRLDLAGVWDEIIEKLRSYELPDEFEGKKEWIDLGTRFRKLVEPLDVANYYRHARHYKDGANSYMDKGRAKRYRYPQRWLEHAERRPREVISESCFWAEVEDIRYKTSNGNGLFEDVKERVERLEAQIKGWSVKGDLAKDALLEGSTLVKWWKTLPSSHREQSCIRSFIE